MKSNQDQAFAKLKLQLEEEVVKPLKSQLQEREQEITRLNDINWAVSSTIKKALALLSSPYLSDQFRKSMQLSLSKAEIDKELKKSLEILKITSKSMKQSDVVMQRKLKEVFREIMTVNEACSIINQQSLQIKQHEKVPVKKIEV